MNNLLREWQRFATREHGSVRVALTALSAAVGQIYDYHSLYSWRRGLRPIPEPVQRVMRAAILRDGYHHTGEGSSQGDSMITNTQILVYDADSELVYEGSLGGFCAVNELDESDMDAIHAELTSLVLGRSAYEPVTRGGGAAPPYFIHLAASQA